jgi:two-component system sensor histidine kinase ChiS
MKRVAFPLSLLLFLSMLFPACKGDSGTNSTPPGPPWVKFTSQNSGLLSNKVNTIAIDRDGKVWIGTEGGASGFLHSSWSSIVDSLAFPIFSSGGSTISHEVNVIAVGRDKSLWFGLAGGGVRRYIPGGEAIAPWHRYTSPDIPLNTVSSIATLVDAEPGDVYVGAIGGGVTRFLPHTGQPELGDWHSDINTYLPSSNVYAIRMNPYTNLPVVGTQGGAAVNYGAANWSYPEPTAVTAIACDLQNMIWMGRSNGVSNYNGRNGQLTQYTNTNTGGKLPPGPVHAVETNLQTTRWFGTDFGLVRLQDTTWTTFTHVQVPELPSDTITALVFDRGDNLWIGTPSGITVYNPNGTRF